MIVISGITSSIGISLAKLLADKGIQVTGFARNVSKVKTILSHPLIAVQQGDLNDHALMRLICSQAQGIVHLAAFSSPWGKYEDFYKVNVEGTHSILQAASQSNLKYFIHISTPSIYFNFRDRLNISEDDPLPLRSVNAYSDTKKMAEEFVDLSGLPTITLRPRAIFGPHDQTLFPRLLNACQKRGIPQFRKNSPIVDVTYVENLANAIYLAMTAPPNCFGQKYNITNGEPCSLNHILDCLLSKLSIKTSKRHIPYYLAYTIASLAELKAKVTNNEPSLTRYGIGLMSYSQTLSIEKAKRELNYSPKVSLIEGIDRYVHWLQTH